MEQDHVCKDLVRLMNQVQPEKEVPLQKPDLVLFTDGSSLVENGVICAGWAAQWQSAVRQAGPKFEAPRLVYGVLEREPATGKERWQMVVPTSLRAAVLQAMHGAAGAGPRVREMACVLFGVVFGVALKGRLSLCSWFSE